ncbi:MAG: LLM class flavin-dependent oxidoreductase [Rhizobiaceae bacterium]
MSRQDQMKLGLSVRGVGYHIAAWRYPGVDPRGEMGLSHYLAAARTAERGKFDMIFFADGVAIRENGDERALSGFSTLARMEPMTLLPALGVLTERIGLVATASTTYNAPYHIARKFATLDHLSGGRACWNAVTSWSDAEALNFGLKDQIDIELRYERATEFIDVVLGLWDSWDDDAFLFDKEGGRFHDPAKLHTLDHKGEFYSVRGPLNVARSPQGRPVVCQAGASEKGREMAARSADVVFCAAATKEAGQTFYRQVKSRLPAYGRKEHGLKVLPGVSAIVGRTEAEAQEKYRLLQSLILPDVGKAVIGTMVGDLSNYDVDDPLPQVEDRKIQSIGKSMQERARTEQLTIRQLYERVANGRGHLSLVGSAEQVAQTMIEWFESGACDGFNVAAPYLPGSLDDFVELVVPILQDRGVFRKDYEGATLRENLGLEYPESRHAH